MAKRMFSTKITSSSQFLMMPQSSQNLYFHLGMNADDDGFCEHFTVMRMTESKPDDLSVLQAKHFVKVFDDKVLIIRDWKVNNYIRSDRYTPSKYLQIYKKELKLLAKQSNNTGMTNDNQMVDADKIRLDKIRLELPVGSGNPTPPKRIKEKQDYKIIDTFLKEIQDILDLPKWADTIRWTRVYAQKCLKEAGREKTLEAVKWMKLNWNSKPTKLKTIFYGIRQYEEKIKTPQVIDLSK